MAYTVPAMPLTCRVWRWYAGPYTHAHPGSFTTACALRLLRTGALVSFATYGIAETSLLVPKGTDIRGVQPSYSGDIVECPDGSGRFYQVGMVEDIAKGFSNEYRFASLSQLQWPFPTP